MTKRGYRKNRGDVLHRKDLSLLALGLVLSFSLVCPLAAIAVDSEVTRATITGLKGVHVMVEDLNPNVLNYEKYLKKIDLSSASLQKNVEARLKQAGIRVLTREEWLQTTGRPALCITVNTHESEKYWFAYDSRIELRQIVFLESNPALRTWAPTWSINITGLTHIGALNVIKTDTLVMVEQFIKALK